MPSWPLSLAPLCKLRAAKLVVPNGPQYVTAIAEPHVQAAQLCLLPIEAGYMFQPRQSDRPPL
jgi:hypothetical protein